MPPEDTQYAADLNNSRGLNHADSRYKDYLRDILVNGTHHEDRTGTGTTRVFGRNLRFDLTQGFPLLTTKKVWMRGVVEELLWFLRGETNIRPLVEKGVSIWTDWPLERYRAVSGQNISKEEFEERIVKEENFAKQWGDLGPVYGKQWRRFGEPDAQNVMGRDEEISFVADKQVDQIKKLINNIQSNPESRRHVVSAWNPQEIEDAALPPCHYAFQVFVRDLTAEERQACFFDQMKFMSLEATPYDINPNEEELKQTHKFLDEQDVPRKGISLMWQQRSVDSFLGLPFNIASYALLAHLIGQQTGMLPCELVFNGGDCHIYDNHQKQVKELLGRSGYPFLSNISLPDDPPSSIAEYTWEDIEIKDYKHRGQIDAPIAV